MTRIGTPLSSTATRVLMCGSGELGKEVVIELQRLGCEVIAYDPHPNNDVKDLGIQYVSLEKIWAESDIISLHCPLVPATRHIINSNSIYQMKQGVALINTSRGALIDTREIIGALKTGRIGYLGLDVYEEEANLFFEDKSNLLLQDDIFARLQTFPDDYLIHGSWTESMRQLGNAVPVTLAEIVARSIYQSLHRHLVPAEDETLEHVEHF